MIPIYSASQSSYTLPSIPSQYHISKWKEYPTFWEYTAPQHDENNNANLDWLAVKYCRVSGTGCGYIMGHGYEKNKSLQDCALEFCGIQKKEFTPEALSRMNHGTINEDVARKLYEQKHNVTVSELGFVIPKWNPYIGISPDGCVDQPDNNGIYGNIEIKCPQKMYPAYLNYMNQENPNPYDYSHIWKSHFDQMQWGMGIMGRGWCDYIVVDTFKELYYDQRVIFNQSYFNEMYAKVCQFIETYIKSLVQGTSFPLMPLFQP